ncbi:MAG: polysulfide reductase NrfD [Dehalococcoidales bacterium]|nr:polysulfide reductase NrfD [Dehalococcoidales bacterium]
MEQEINVIYNVIHEPPLGVPIAIYFYMTGLSAGSFILSTLAYGFGVQKYKPLGKVGVVLAVLLLMLAPLNLIADLGQQFRFWHLFPYLNITSPITYGTFLLTLYPLNCVIYAWFMFSGNHKLTKIFGLIGIPLATSVHGYTGFILALSKARALWNTALMPILFLVSAMVSGLALMILVVIIRGRFFSLEKKIDTDLVFDLGKILAFSIIGDLFLIFSDIAVLLTADSEAREAAMLILTLNFSPIFLGGEILLGALVPLFLLFFPPTGKRILPVALAAVLVMVGIMAMRYVMVIGGQSVPLS